MGKHQGFGYFILFYFGGGGGVWLPLLQRFLGRLGRLREKGERLEGLSTHPAPIPGGIWGGHGTVGVGTDGAALSEGDLSVGAVGGVLADHLVAEDVAAVADADLAGLGFPHILVVVREPILYAASSLDWENGAKGAGASGARLRSPPPHIPGIPPPFSSAPPASAASLPSSGSHQPVSVTQEKHRHNKLFPLTLEFKQNPQPVAASWPAGAKENTGGLGGLRAGNAWGEGSAQSREWGGRRGWRAGPHIWAEIRARMGLDQARMSSGQRLQAEGGCGEQGGVPKLGAASQQGWGGRGGDAGSPRPGDSAPPAPPRRWPRGKGKNAANV